MASQHRRQEAGLCRAKPQLRYVVTARVTVPLVGLENNAAIDPLDDREILTWRRYLTDCFHCVLHCEPLVAGFTGMRLFVALMLNSRSAFGVAESPVHLNAVAALPTVTPNLGSALYF